MSGIYKICSLIDDRIYVGSAKNIIKRRQQHFYTLRCNKHGNSKLQNFYNNYGVGRLKFEVIEYCPVENLIEREQYYFDTLLPTFNIHPKAGSRLGAKHSEEVRLKLYKPIHQYDLDGRFVKTWPSIPDAAMAYKCDRSGINKCCKKTFASFIGYMWSYTKADSIERYINPRSFPVYQYDKDYNLVAEFESITEAAKKTKINKNFLSLVCSGQRGIAKGYYFTKTPCSKEEFEILHYKKFICVFDENWNEVYRHPDLQNVSETVNVNTFAISRHLNSLKHKTYKKYYFRYEDDLPDKN